MKFFKLILTVSLVCVSLTPVFASESPEGILKNLWQEIRILSRDQDTTHREITVRELLRAHYAFEDFYNRALQDHWPEWTSQQKQDFGSRFETIFLESLVRKLRRVPRGDVSFRIESRQETGQNVVISLRGIKGEKQIGFRVFFVKTPADWKIDDVEVGGALLSRNYRGQFNRILRNDGFESLLARLDQQRNQRGEPYETHAEN